MAYHIKTVEFSASVFEINQFPQINLPMIGIIGRSNAGKSSFINTITQNKKMAHTSKTPGKTKSLNFYLLNKSFYFIDFPGYGYGTVPYFINKKWNALINFYFTHYTAKQYMFFLIDIRRDPDDLDLSLIEDFRERMIPVIYIITKSDKVAPSKHAAYLNKFKNFFMCEESSIILFSSLYKTGVDVVKNYIASIVVH